MNERNCVINENHSVIYIHTGCPKKNSHVGFVHFSQPLRRARIKVRCALYSSFNGEYFKRLNFTIW